jgi:hypothetical protein
VRVVIDRGEWEVTSEVSGTWCFYCDMGSEKQLRQYITLKRVHVTTLAVVSNNIMYSDTVFLATLIWKAKHMRLIIQPPVQCLC